MLRFGFSESAAGSLLSVEFDDYFVNDAANYDKDFEKRLAIGKKTGSLIHELLIEKGSQQIIFDFPAIFRKRNPDVFKRASQAATNTLFSICNTPTLYGDPLMRVWMGQNPYPGDDSRFPMEATVSWPTMIKQGASAELRVAGLAGQKMRKTARDINYLPNLSPKLRMETIFAIVSRESGVTLETLREGSCSLDTDGQVYNPASEVFDLDDHNLYQHNQQVVLLAGVVAIAHADELLSPQN